MKSWMKRLVLIVLIPILGILIWIGSFAYHVYFEKTEILTADKDGEPYQLTIYMIGEPEWPFGPVHCRLDLYEKTERISQHSIELYNDGTSAEEDNFFIVWTKEGVKITATASEQDPVTYYLRFDGTIEQKEERS